MNLSLYFTLIACMLDLIPVYSHLNVLLSSSISKKDSSAMGCVYFCTDCPTPDREGSIGE